MTQIHRVFTPQGLAYIATNVRYAGRTHDGVGNLLDWYCGSCGYHAGQTNDVGADAKVERCWRCNELNVIDNHAADAAAQEVWVARMLKEPRWPWR